MFPDFPGLFRIFLGFSGFSQIFPDFPGFFCIFIKSLDLFCFLVYSAHEIGLKVFKSCTLCIIPLNFIKKAGMNLDNIFKKQDSYEMINWFKELRKPFY